jgi:hypothetical protein
VKVARLPLVLIALTTVDGQLDAVLRVASAYVKLEKRSSRYRVAWRRSSSSWRGLRAFPTYVSDPRAGLNRFSERPRNPEAENVPDDERRGVLLVGEDRKVVAGDDGDKAEIELAPRSSQRLSTPNPCSVMGPRRTSPVMIGSTAW